MGEIELKPCPFCGGKAVFREMSWGMSTFYIKCTKCGMQTASNHEPKAKQAKDWNRRVHNE
mgnify:CR=1 FL=1